MDKDIGKGLTIFILDDEKDICQFTKEFFAKRGFRVYTALTSKAAISTIKKVSPDIALLDIRLGDNEEGLDVLKTIRESHPKCQCVMVTYMDNEKTMQEASELGAVGYLKKPLMLPEIEKAIKTVVKAVNKGVK